MHQRNLIIILLCFLSGISFGQNDSFSLHDTLRGSITPERAWWDLKYYHLDVEVNPRTKSIKGYVMVQYTVIESHNEMQIDLQSPLKIDLVVNRYGEELEYHSIGDAHFIQLKTKQVLGHTNKIVISYSGIPTEAKNPPWDGGVSWDKDQNGKDIIHTNCQGIGASIWWPCKDHLYDEPDSMLISINVPDNLMNVSNGKLRAVVDKEDGTKTWHWFVSNPISNYVININAADYVHFGEKYEGEKGTLDMDYYVMPYNLEKAKEQFKDARRMMEAFEHWFGPYPFYEDGYKLVEVPSTGMEHQSSVTYGNGYKNGYRGRDGSGTGHGFLFDFIIIHESGHEWFANNITYKDMADMWIHESFTNYSESLFLEYHYGKEIGQEYCRGTRKLIRNDSPIIGPYGVNRSGSGDMYVKGGNMLNTIRSVIGDDDKWREILRGLNKTFYHQTVTTQEIEGYINEKAGFNYQKVFDQYLRDIRVPMLEYYFLEGKFFFRWGNCVNGFDMPVDVKLDGQYQRIVPRQGKWSSIAVSKNEMKVDPNYFISVLEAF